MYEQVFGFTARPFAAAPLVQNYFPAESIHYAMSQARLCIERGSGPIVVTGSSGTGKSLLMAMLCDQYSATFQVVNIYCSNLVERKDLLQHILFELNMPYRDMSEGELRLSLIDYLKTGRQPNGVLMLVDDAHTLSADLLDELRSITTFVQNGRPAISLVMAGTPSLEGNLIDTKSESFNQRIAARSYLSNLGKNETIEYVLTQIERSGGQAETLFTGDALNRVFEVSDGCPRLINQVCDYALVIAASLNANRVTNEIVSEAWNDVQSIPGSTLAQTIDQSSSTIESHCSDEAISSGDLVLEFGTLDDDDSTSSQLDTVEKVQSETIGNAMDFDTEVVDEYRLQDEENAVPGAAADISQFDYSIASPTVSETETERELIVEEIVEQFDDPFAESFEAEEAVDPSYVPFVSAQNINSLMVTPQQLALLEMPFEAVGEDLSVAIQQDDQRLSVVHDEQEVASDQHEDLMISAESLASLDQMQEDIRRLQRDFQFSKQDFSSEAVHPDFAVVTNDQPIEELFQEHSVATEPSDAVGQPPIVVAADNPIEAKEVEGLQTETLIGGDNTNEDDDRDIMIISQPERFQVESNDEELSLEGSEVRISTGQAQRMDYHDLFRQLRSAN